MSDVAHLRQIRPARPHLPVSWYFDPAIFELEKKLLFDAGSNYVGHELMVPKVGDNHTLNPPAPCTVLVRSPEGLELLSNICPHPQGIMLEGRGNTENIV